MSAGGGAGTSGRAVPANTGVDYGHETLENANDAERVFDLGTETTSIIIRAHPDNSGRIFIGFDDDVVTTAGDDNGGMVLTPPDDSITLGIDVSQVPVFAVAASAGDHLIFMAIR